MMSPNAKKMSSLYVLVFPERGLIKIGKANNTRDRGRVLKPYWGAADYAESFELKAPTEMVFKLEKSLHFLLSSHKADVSAGDGHTEMFLIGAIDAAVTHLELFASSGASKSTLKKGIESDSFSRGGRKQQIGSDDLLTEKAQKVHRWVPSDKNRSVENHLFLNNIAMKIAKLERFQRMLIRREKYIPYRKSVESNNLILQMTCKFFTIAFRDGYVSLFTSISVAGGNVTYVVSMPADIVSCDANTQPMAAMAFEKVALLFESLPTCSSAGMLEWGSSEVDMAGVPPRA